MNWDRIEGNWKQAKGRFKEHWGRMTHRHLYVIDGRRDRTLGEIQESYGIAKDEVSREVKSRKQPGAHTPDETKRRIARKHARLTGR